MRGELGIFLFTMKEAVRKGTLIAYFVIGTIIIAIFALGIGLSPEDSSVITFFGAKMPARGIQDENVVDLLLLQLYSSASGGIMLLGLFGTAGLIPSFLEKGTAELFLSKPVSRMNVFIARFVGALAGITLNIVYFTIGMWLVFGIKLGVWHWGFLASSLLTSYIFACFFSVAVIAGIVTQSTGVAIILGFSFSILSGMLETREALLFKVWDNAIYHRTLDLLYYVTPQLDAMSKSAGTIIGKYPISRNLLVKVPETFDILPFLYSTLSAGAFYVLAILYFKRKDY